MRRVFQQTVSFTLQRHRWEGQLPLAAQRESFPTLGMSVTSTHQLLSGGTVISAVLPMSP